MKRERIALIDDFRAMAMMYVIFIHCLFWLGYGEEAVKSLFLVEMPLFFAITGMSHVFARMDDLKRYVLSRLERILIPCWAYAVIVIVLNGLWYLYKGSSDFSLRQTVIGWLYPFGGHPSLVPFLNYAIWFVPVYLIAMLLIPFLRRIFDRLDGIGRFLPLAVLLALNALLTYGLPDNYLTQSVLFYTLWIYCGFWFIERIYARPFSDIYRPCIGLSCLSGVLLALLSTWGGTDGHRRQLGHAGKQVPAEYGVPALHRDHHTVDRALFQRDPPRPLPA